MPVAVGVVGAGTHILARLGLGGGGAGLGEHYQMAGVMAALTGPAMAVAHLSSGACETLLLYSVTVSEWDAV